MRSTGIEPWQKQRVNALTTAPARNSDFSTRSYLGLL